MNALTWCAFVVAGAVGAPVRYMVDGAVAGRVKGIFPWATLVVNVTGSFILGLITGLALYHGMGKGPRLVLGTGFCGAYTTFSTFSFETVRLLEEGETTHAVRNVVGSLMLGTAAAGLGLALATL